MDEGYGEGGEGRAEERLSGRAILQRSARPTDRTTDAGESGGGADGGLGREDLGEARGSTPNGAAGEDRGNGAPLSDNGYVIRSATRDDIPGVLKLVAKFKKERLESLPLSLNLRDVAVTLVKLVDSGEGVVMVALEGDEVVGAIVGIAFPSFLNSEAKILGELMWYVDSGHRDSGVGKKLLKAFEDEARVLEVDVVEMGSFEPGLEAVGYTPIERHYLKGVK